MLIVLPDERNGLPDLLQKLTANATEFARILEKHNYMFTRVSLGLPKFSIHGDTIPLVEQLTSMGRALCSGVLLTFLESLDAVTSMSHRYNIRHSLM